MRFRLLLVVCLLQGAPASAEVTPPGAWKTFVRTRNFTDLIALKNEVWCATGESGLLRFDRSRGEFEVIRREPGSISSNRLTGLTYDRSGRLWASSAGAGVSRLSADRSRWDVVNVFDGLPVDTVNVLRADGDTVWIGTSQGIALWDGTQVAGSLPDGNTLSFDTTFSSTSITGIVVLGDSLWLSTRRGIGLAHLSTGLQDWRRQTTGINATDISAMATDGHSLFALSSGSPFRYREDLAQWEFVSGAGVVHSLADDDGVVLAAGGSGLFRWDGSGWVGIPGSPVVPSGALTSSAPALDPDGVAFMGDPSGLHEEQGGGAWSLYPPPPGPPGNDLLHVALDDSRVYVTTFSQGVGRFDGTQWRYWLPGTCSGAGCDTTFRNPVFALGLLVDRVGQKWVGCWGVGVDVLDDRSSPPSVRHFFSPSTKLDTLKHTWQLSSAVDSAGGRWFGMDTPLKGDVDPIGLEAYDASDTGAYVGNFNPTNSKMAGSFVHGLTVSKNGRVWLGYEGQGVDFFTPPASSDAFIHIISTNNLDVRGLAAHGDSVWVLTTADLRRYAAGSAANAVAQRIYPIPEGQPQLAVRPIEVGPDGSVWVATAGGLRAFHPDGTSEHFTTQNSPIADDEVRGLAVDRQSGVVWLTTAAGLNRYDPHYVAPPPAAIPSLSIVVYPNPVLTSAIGTRLYLSGDASAYAGEIYDLAGRRVRRIAASGNHQVVWDGRDEDGNLVKPGVYFVRAEAGGRSAVARVVVLH